MKELRFSPVIGDHDIEHKLKQAKEFIEKGHEVMFSMYLKGRQRHHFDLAEEKMNGIVGLCSDYGEEVFRKKLANTILVRVAKRTIKKENK